MYPVPVPRRFLGGTSPLTWLALLALATSPAAAQPHTHDGSARVHAGASATGLLTRTDPALAGHAFTEGYLTRPVAFTMASWRGLGFVGMLNFEGMTLERGELNAGVSGEGYIDRRHPHTFLHEMVVTAAGRAGSTSASLAAGRGFAPFGTDDPMVRPLIKYPANHHLAQILERWIVIGAVRRGPVLLEVGLFNGDEPTAPESLGRPENFADSWSTRITLVPLNGVEIQGSHARVESPEHGTGGGLDHRKWSASARLERTFGTVPAYGLVEWARTDEHTVRRRAFSFGSTLAEASVDLGGTTVALRFERTTRAEEERLENAFRSARPHADENVLGVTRWRSATLNVGHVLESGPLRVNPFVEVSHLRVEEITGSIFDPLEFYGADRLWSLSVGVRLGAGMGHARMGRYAVAVPENEWFE